MKPRLTLGSNSNGNSLSRANFADVFNEIIDIAPQVEEIRQDVKEVLRILQQLLNVQNHCLEEMIAIRDLLQQREEDLY